MAEESVAARRAFMQGVTALIGTLDKEISALQETLDAKRDERNRLAQVGETWSGGGGGGRGGRAAGRRAATTGSRQGQRRGPGRTAARAAATATAPRRRAAGRTATAPSSTEDRQQQILRLIAKGAMSTAAVAKASGLSNPRARQLLDNMHKTGMISSEERNEGRGRPKRYWSQLTGGGRAAGRRKAKQETASSGNGSKASGRAAGSPQTSGRGRGRQAQAAAESGGGGGSGGKPGTESTS